MQIDWQSNVLSLSERDGKVLIWALIYCAGSARSRTAEQKSVSALLLTAGAGLGPPDIQRAHSDKWNQQYWCQQFGSSTKHPCLASSDTDLKFPPRSPDGAELPSHRAKIQTRELKAEYEAYESADGETERVYPTIQIFKCGMWGEILLVIFIQLTKLDN